MASVPTNEARQVAINTAVASIFDPNSFPNRLGFTARIYAIVINVVIPAITSVLTVVRFSFNLKYFSNILSPISFTNY